MAVSLIFLVPLPQTTLVLVMVQSSGVMLPLMMKAAGLSSEKAPQSDDTVKRQTV